VKPQPAGVLRVGTVTDNGTTILARTSVGSAVFLLGQRGTNLRFGASFDGSDPGDNWETFGDRRGIAADTISLVGPGNFPDAGQEGIATVTGQVGGDVAGIDIHTHAGRTVTAVISDGYWIAVWEGQDFSDRDTLDVTFTLHLANGLTETVSYENLDGSP
jgi:hypothetical protein